ncbi:LysR family transcriptional regulator [Novosphingobium sp. ERN07]|uniref:LysR family transcriptional regulator n=1 Tax=Novosphingobium sp. ERN07 TaxID=2726187 RepID=UPI0014565B45|nr:LysR family transcriptional regulator [Novosphingobium sp. ERN07]
MEVRHLRYFLAVVEQRGFTRAAEHLGVSQPPLSRQIRDLEIELGVELFERGTRPVQLTEAGRLLFEQAAPVVAALDQIKPMMKRWKQARRPRFAVGVVGSILHGDMPAMIRRFRAMMPEVEVELVEMITLEQVAALKTGRIDAGLGRVAIDDPAIVREVLLEEPLMVAMPADSPLAENGGAVPIAMLEGERLILYPSQPRPTYADQVLAMLTRNAVVPSSTREVREVQTALGLVAIGEGMAIVPEALSQTRHGSIVYRPLAGIGAISPVILSQRATDSSATARAFRNAGRETWPNLGDRSPPA